MKTKKQSLEQVKKTKGNLISLTVKDVTKVKGGKLKERTHKSD